MDLTSAQWTFLEHPQDSEARLVGYKRGVMVTPALSVDGQIKSAGKVLKPEETAKLLG